MLPFHGDLVARIGQFPFYLAGGIALFALARRAGARREHAVYAPLFFLLARPVVAGLAADADLDIARCADQIQHAIDGHSWAVRRTNAALAMANC